MYRLAHSCSYSTVGDLFFNFKKRYSVTNKGLITANKRFLWTGVGAPGSVHDSTLLQSSTIFYEIESGHVLPHNVLILPQGKI